ncbi:MAG: hypothetical protein A3B95_01250 [Candidatus Doudnabacteria bacterium RIFCSPHIGHO2_02_FULL_43_13b]|nr:MAG: hypothetical protein A3B95_01250 [Candidatus Doudnabacteria bacterium RIFCSPHIGHO2_02_FULL_43_13b]
MKGARPRILSRGFFPTPRQGGSRNSDWSVELTEAQKFAIIKIRKFQFAPKWRRHKNQKSNLKKA